MQQEKKNYQQGRLNKTFEPALHKTQGGSGQTNMEALERQADKIRAARAQGAAGAAGGAVEANPEEIDLDMDMDEAGGVSFPCSSLGRYEWVVVYVYVANGGGWS